MRRRPSEPGATDDTSREAAGDLFQAGDVKEIGDAFDLGVDDVGAEPRVGGAATCEAMSHPSAA